METPLSNERGAVLILVAVAAFTLVAFSAIVVDYGILWASRGQAQTSADAGALAGAIEISVGESDAVARDAASAVARQNSVWGEQSAAGDVVVTVPLECPLSAGGGDEGCIRVDVMRGAPDAQGNPHTNVLPVFFASLLGIGQQGVRATATAQSAAGNASSCIKPWAVADKWLEVDNPAWDQNDLFLQGTDIYRSALTHEGHTEPTGFTLAAYNGYQLALKAGDVGTWTAGWSREIDFPGCPGSNCYRDAIEGCPSFVPTVGYWAGQTCEDPDDTDPARGCLGVKTGMSQGPTSQGVGTVYDTDPDAYWNGTKVVSTYRTSPRIQPVVLFHTGDYVAQDCSGTTCMVKVVSIMGFFIEGMCDEVASRGQLESYTNCGTGPEPNKTVVGRMVADAAQFLGGAGEISPDDSFLKIIRLVR